VITEVERIVEKQVPVEVIKTVEDTAKTNKLLADINILTNRILELENQDPVEKIIEVERIVEKEVPVDRFIEVEKAASGDLKTAAQLLASSEFNKEDLSEKEIYELLQKSSEDEVKRKIGFWAMPLPAGDGGNDINNKKYKGKTR
jgi:hypothetical protein